MFSPRFTSASKWIIVILIAALTSLYNGRIKIQEDALDLLPDQILASEINSLQQVGFTNRIYIHLRYITANNELKPYQWKSLKTSVIKIGSLLQQENIFSEVIFKLKDGYELNMLNMVWDRLPYLLTEKDFETIESMLSDKQIRQKLTQNFLLLNTPAGITLKEQIVRDPLGLSLLAANHLRKLQGQLVLKLKEGLFTSDDEKSCLIWLDSKVALTDSKQAVKVQRIIEAAIKKGAADGVQVSLIGALPHTLANVKTIKNDLKTLIPIATITLALYLFAVFRKWKSFLVLCVPFLAVPPSIALLHFYSHKISGLALGFGIVLLGIAVDFAIHIYFALEKQSGPPKLVLKRLRKPLFMALCTTIGVFFILLYSSVSSHRQMAFLAICGVSFALLISRLLIPTFTQPAIDQKSQNSSKPVKNKLPSMPVIICWAVLIFSGMAVWPELSYNGDMRLFDAADKKTQKAETNFKKIWKQSLDQTFIFISGDSLDSVLDENDQLYSLISKKLGNRVHSISPLLPGPKLCRMRAVKWNNFWRNNKEILAEKLNRIGTDIGFKQNTFASFLHFANTPPVTPDNNKILHGFLHPLFASVISDKREKDENQKEYSFVLTMVDMGQDSSWTHLLNLKGSHPKITLLSTKKWRQEVEQLLQKDVIKLATTAAIFVFLLTVLFFRRIGPVLAALAPVCSALASMVLFAYITNQQLNLMHVLMGLMVIGLSVDYGIFSVCVNEGTVSGTTRKAISTCAISTCIGFGVLAFASHPALKAIGITVLVSISIAWPTALYVTPAILKVSAKRQSKKSVFLTFFLLLFLSSCTFKPVEQKPQLMKLQSLNQSLWQLKVIHNERPEFTGLVGVKITDKGINLVILDATGILLFKGLITSEGAIQPVGSFEKIRKSGLPDMLATIFNNINTCRIQTSSSCHWYFPVCINKLLPTDNRAVTIKRIGPYELWKITSFMNSRTIERILFSKRFQSLVLDMKRMKEARDD